MSNPENEKPKIQGEGDYEATRRFRKRTEEYLENNDVEKAALRAAPEDDQEAAELEAAEEAGKSRAKDEDPGRRPDPSKPDPSKH